MRMGIVSMFPEGQKESYRTKEKRIRRLYEMKDKTITRTELCTGVIECILETIELGNGKAYNRVRVTSIGGYTVEKYIAPVKFKFPVMENNIHHSTFVQKTDVEPNNVWTGEILTILCNDNNTRIVFEMIYHIVDDHIIEAEIKCFNNKYSVKLDLFTNSLAIMVYNLKVGLIRTVQLIYNKKNAKSVRKIIVKNHKRKNGGKNKWQRK